MGCKQFPVQSQNVVALDLLAVLGFPFSWITKSFVLSVARK
jgi:hypothetical protein